MFVPINAGRGKLKSARPEELAKACCLGNLPPWGEGAEPQVLTNEGLGDFLPDERLKSKGLATHHQPNAIGTAFGIPRGSMRGIVLT